MDTYRTEEEQLEVLKNWWRDNGQAILLTICVGCALMFGWRAWQDSQISKRELASVEFQELVDAVNVAQQDPKSEINAATVDHLLEKMQNEHGGSGYAQFTEILAAYQLAVNGDLQGAEQHLRNVLTIARDAGMQVIASMRLARVLAAQSKTDEALTLLEKVSSEHMAGVFAPAIYETKGDIYLAAKDYANAKQAYAESEEALIANSQPVPRLLEMKKSFINSYL